MRFAAPSVVCPRCGHESPPSGAGRFMTCAKCGMSIDAHAGERQEAVRGRVKEKPEIEIDPTLPAKPSKFPLGFAIALALLVAGGVVYLAFEIRARRAAAVVERQRINLRAAEQLQQAFVTLWTKKPSDRESPSCRMLFDKVTRPCLPTVDPSKLRFEEAVLAIDPPSASCADALEIVSRSRIDARCD